MRARFFSISIAVLLLPAPALAQEGAGAGPATAGGSEVVDPREAELQRMQNEAERDGTPDASTAVVERAPAVETPPADSMTHENQVGLRLGLGVPFIFAVKYGKGPACDDTRGAEGNEFCRHFGAPMIDLELSFGVSDTVELGAVARFGLADDEAANANPLAFGIGARAFTSPHAMFKGFLGAHFMLDLTQRRADPTDVAEWSSVDVGARGQLGLQLDVARYFGVYVQLGATIMILRALSFAFDGSAGVQGRLP